MACRASVLIAVLFTGWLSLISCSKGPDRSEGFEGWNVLLITLDTTRQDRLGFHGREGAGTPNLDRLAAEGVVFDQAIAQAPITLPTHASILTGTYPPYHGVRGNGFYSLPDDRVTLAEVLGDEGYATGGVIAARVLDRRFGLAQGFARFDDDPGSMSRGNVYTDYTRRAAAVNESALSMLSELDKSKPYFLWVHYFDPHAPYDPIPEFASRFPATLEGQYQAEISAVDHRIGELLDRVDASRGLERTLIVVTADHGEGFPGPHDEQSHGIFVYRDTVRVPLVFWAKSGLASGRRSDSVVEQVDIFPTVLDLLGLGEGDEAQGYSLREILTGADDAALASDRVAYSEAILPWYKFGWSPLLAVRDAKWKFIDAPTPELYDLESDPDEQSNVATEHPDLVERYRGSIRRILREGSGIDGYSGELVTTDEERDKLIALGYASSGRPVPSGEGIETLKKLKDPKDWAYVQVRLNEARDLASRGQEQESRRLLEELIDADPANYEAYSILLMQLLARDELDEAQKRLEEILRFRPDVSKVYTAYGALERKRAAKLAAEGRSVEAKAALERAMSRFEKAVELERFEVDPMVNLATLYVDASRLEDAARVLEKARKIDARDARSAGMLGTLYVQLGRPADAVPVLRAAIDAGVPDPSMERVMRGQLIEAALRTGQLDVAETSLRWMEERFPKDPTVQRVRSMIEQARAGGGSGG